MRKWVGIAITAGIAAVVIAWHRNDWDVEATGMVGDSVAPFAALVTGGALFAALRSLTEQQRATRLQLAETQRQHGQRLAEAYAAWFSAVDQWLRCLYQVALADVRVTIQGVAKEQAGYPDKTTMGRWDEESKRATWLLYVLDEDADRRLAVEHLMNSFVDVEDMELPFKPKSHGERQQDKAYGRIKALEQFAEHVRTELAPVLRPSAT
jgi:hypothetical protein